MQADALTQLIKAAIDAMSSKDEDYIIVSRSMLETFIRNTAEPKALNTITRQILESGSSKGTLDARSPLLHDQIKRKRKSAGISQIELAKEAGVEQPDISEFERNGGKGFSLERTERIIAALNRLVSDGPPSTSTNS